MIYTVIDRESREISDESYGHFRLPETDDGVERDFGPLNWIQKKKKKEKKERNKQKDIRKKKGINEERQTTKRKKEEVRKRG